jgi:hypothetical protein
MIVQHRVEPEFTVYVYALRRYDRWEHPDKLFKPQLIAYTRYRADGCCVHQIRAKSGYAAKKAAIRQHREECLPEQPK